MEGVVPLILRFVHESAYKFVRDTVKNSVKQINGNILETITPEEFHVLEKIHQNSYKKSFHLIKKCHIQNFDELISKNKITLSVTGIAYKKETGY